MVSFILFKANFNDRSVVSWRSVLLVNAIGIPGEDNRLAESHCQTLSHNIVSSALRHERYSNSQR
jgi:hypothetical protein